MNRFHIISFILHFVVFSTLIFISNSNSMPMPKFEIVKVHIAPLPQPKILSVEEPIQEEIEKEVKKDPQKEKAAPEKEKIKEKTKKIEKKTEQVIKKGLPDIKPKIYTGSGRGFTYSYYLNILLNKINKTWQNPFKGKDIILRSVVYFEIDKTGKIYNVRLEENSGNDLYNETTIRAVTLTKRLPPLPQEFSDDYLKVHLEFLTAQ